MDKVRETAFLAKYAGGVGTDMTAAWTSNMIREETL
jgi:hypothetical protein